MYMSKRDDDAITYRKANRNPVARKLREREFQPRVVPERKIYKRERIDTRRIAAEDFE